MGGKAQAHPPDQKHINLPTSKILWEPVAGNPQKTNSFPTNAALSPDGRYLAILNNGRGSAESQFQQSIAVLDLETHQLKDYPDPRLKVNAHQTYFLGLAFGSDGKEIYASIASLTDPEGRRSGDTGNGIAVYNFAEGKVSASRFLPIKLQTLAAGKRTGISSLVPKGKAIPYPAGLAVVRGASGDKLLVANNLADNVVLLDAQSGKTLASFNLSTRPNVPAVFPYAVIVSRDGKRAYCSLWNGSSIAELDLARHQVTRTIPLLPSRSPTAPSSHPTAMQFNPDEKLLYVALANADAIAVVDTESGKLLRTFSTLLPGQKQGGTCPNALALSADGQYLFAAAASLDAVAVFDLRDSGGDSGQSAVGFIPTEWYPTALAVSGDNLLIATGKGEGTGPNSGLLPGSEDPGEHRRHPYIASLIRGSVAQVSIPQALSSVKSSTEDVLESNLMRGNGDTIPFRHGGNPIKHIIYIIKENRTYDQIFGDLHPGDADPSLCMYGQDITPNEHALARQFGVLDNFYDSGEVSGDGHVWSNAAITSDYTEKTWQIAYRGSEHTYDFEGEVAGGVPLRQGIPDVNDPGTGVIWKNVADHGLTHRNYGEFVATHWCDEAPEKQSPLEGTPLPKGMSCNQRFIHHGDPLPAGVGATPSAPSPWPWPVPIIALDVASKPELVGHFDPHFADFRLDYPDQYRVDEFLREFAGFVEARQQGHGEGLPQFVILRLPNDHTAGTHPNMPKPEASVADNDLAVGRVAEAVSHSPYWDDTAIFILEDDAQDGADHVDAHRSIALVISKYSPGSAANPYVDHGFYTTVNMVHTMETLMGLPPMNNNDAHATVMAPMFSGDGTQPPYTANPRNRENGLIYKMNPPKGQGANESSLMDFTHADAADAHKLNAILWKERMGNKPEPAPRHTVIPEGED
jgi:DNA-binding beta-propeller fold protein YncE